MFDSAPTEAGFKTIVVARLLSQRRRAPHAIATSTVVLLRRIVMGKYLIGWLLGIPAIVLVFIYLVFGK
jgi:hypothetical protein